jgi:hypothetical protein
MSSLFKRNEDPKSMIFKALISWAYSSKSIIILSGFKSAWTTPAFSNK